MAVMFVYIAENHLQGSSPYNVMREFTLATSHAIAKNVAKVSVNTVTYVSTLCVSIVIATHWTMLGK